MTKDDILSTLTETMKRAYAPYSKFHVASVILSKSGKSYSGCNVENAAYPLGTCAEAGAIASMVQGGDREINEIYVMGSGDALVTPCGGCRQKIREFATQQTRIHVCGPEGIRKSYTMDDLLPDSFGPHNLTHD
ncbi:cytidine deaminase [Kiloniella laminariae]|uniref:Cytidine deaminase n=1 Tax=Kiloniella laminariae TaxID=454162 RepID=A0ABT4LNI1_9PROT|nr:cytidine deaminase [Kiloniella laminariae]MCZ4282671.1 cytidine deaminase [Kiloniella laminariae]